MSLGFLGIRGPSLEKVTLPRQKVLNIGKDKLAKGKPKNPIPYCPYLLLVLGEIGRDFSAFGRDFPTHMERRNFLTTLALLVLPGASLLAKLKPTPPRPPPVPCPEPHAAEARNEA